jgi:hypothetical protein
MTSEHTLKENLNKVIPMVNRPRRIKKTSTYELLAKLKINQERAMQRIDKVLNEDTTLK